MKQKLKSERNFLTFMPTKRKTSVQSWDEIFECIGKNATPEHIKKYLEFNFNPPTFKQ